MGNWSQSGLHCTTLRGSYHDCRDHPPQPRFKIFNKVQLEELADDRYSVFTGANGKTEWNDILYPADYNPPKTGDLDKIDDLNGAYPTCSTLSWKSTASEVHCWPMWHKTMVARPQSTAMMEDHPEVAFNGQCCMNKPMSVAPIPCLRARKAGPNGANILSGKEADR
jgi:hypothetical protein